MDDCIAHKFSSRLVNGENTYLTSWRNGYRKGLLNPPTEM